MSDIYQTIIAQNAKIKIDPSEIKPEMLLTEDLGFDSIGFVTMIVELENAYNFSFDPEFIDPEKLKAVKDVIEYVKSMLK